LAGGTGTSLADFRDAVSRRGSRIAYRDTLDGKSADSTRRVFLAAYCAADLGCLPWGRQMEKPLYTFKKDTAPGETNGDGFLNGAWHIAKP